MEPRQGSEFKRSMNSLENLSDISFNDETYIAVSKYESDGNPG